VMPVELLTSWLPGNTEPCVAQGRDDIRTECAGVIAGSWFASGVRRGEELIAAGLLMLAGPVDLDELDRWLRVGWERRRGASCRTAQQVNNCIGRLTDRTVWPFRCRW
jgi:hypothetical protein